MRTFTTEITKQRCTRHWWLKLDALDTQCLFQMSDISNINDNDAQKLTKIHNVISANGAVVHNDVPGPKGHLSNKLFHA